MGKPAHKWGDYESERKEFAFAMRGLKSKNEATVEARLVDWSDDLAYAIHDVQDFYRAGLIPLEKLRDPNERRPFQEATTQWLTAKGLDETQITRVFATRGFFDYMPLFAYSGSNSDRAAQQRR